MRDASFRDVTELELMPGVVSPLVGRVGTLRVSAGIIPESGGSRGYVLLANDRTNQTDMPNIDDTFWRHAGGIVLDPIRDVRTREWEVDAQVPNERVVDLIGHTATRRLFPSALMRYLHDELVILVNIHSSARTDDTYINGMPFDEVSWL